MGPEAEGAVAPPPKRRAPWLQLLFPIVVLVLLLGVVLPQLIDYAAVWDAIVSLDAVAFLALIAMGVGASFAEAGVYTSLIPGLGLIPGWRAFLGGNTIAGFAPAPWDIVVRYAMYRGFGVEGSLAGASVVVGGGFQIAFAVLTPIVALVVLVATGHGEQTARIITGLAVAAAVGTIILISLGLKRESLAAGIGRLLQRTADWILPKFKKKPPVDLVTTTLNFRTLVMRTLASRWGLSALFLLISHIIRYFGMLFLFRQVGIGADLVPAIELLAVYTIGLLMALMPIVPAGLGAVELTYIWLIAGDDPALADLVAAATFTHRVFFWLLPIFIGIWPLVSWRRGGSGLSDLSADASGPIGLSSNED